MLHALLGLGNEKIKICFGGGGVFLVFFVCFFFIYTMQCYSFPFVNRPPPQESNLVTTSIFVVC